MPELVSIKECLPWDESMAVESEFLFGIDESQRIKQENKNRLIELAKTRGKVVWRKTWESKEKGSKIYVFNFRKFYRFAYKSRNLSMIDNPASLIFKETKAPSAWQKSWTTNFKYIFSFKNGKFRIYKEKKGRLIGVSIFNLFRYGGFNIFNCVSVTPNEYPGLVKFERRLIELILTKCRVNKVPLPRGLRATDNFVTTLHKIAYPTLAQILEVEPDCKILGGQLNQKIIFDAFKLDIKRAVRNVTGFKSKGVTRRFTKIIKDWSVGKLMWARVLKGYASVDLLQKIWDLDRMSMPDFDQRAEMKDYRELIALYKDNPLMIVKWTQCPSYEIRDAINSWKEILKHQPEFKPEPINNTTEFHDYLSKYFRKLKAKDRDIAHSKKLIELGIEGETCLDYVITLPKTTEELKDWGDTMSNCIGGYVYQIENNISWILGVKKDNVIQFGIQVDPNTYQIGQFRGKYNAAAPAELVAEFNRILRKKLDERDSLELALLNSHE